MQYIAVIGDIIESKQTLDRQLFQSKLETVLLQVNTDYADHFASPFTITKGDEFQALCLPNASIFMMIDRIQEAFYGQISIRFGIGLGEILTEINPKQSIGADGPAYWQAREAIDFIHDHNDYGTSQLAFSSEVNYLNQAVNALLTSSDYIKAGWNKTQHEFFQQLLEAGIYSEDFKQKPLAQAFELSQSAFTKRLKSSGVKLYLRNRQTAVHLILQTAKALKQRSDQT
ncbi:TPA: SatD family protein [Streptococcus suis]